MIIDRTHRPWFLLTMLLLAAACGAYYVYVRDLPGGPTGGSLPGLLFGIAGSALMLFCGLITLRKKVPRWRIGSAQAWLRAHIWLGLLSVPVILFHAGFHWGGLLEKVLLLVLAGIIASGIFGLVMQSVLTRMMTSQVPLETFYDQVSHVCRVLQLRGDVEVATVSGPLPLAPLESVATKDRLARLNVPGREPLWLIYQQPEGQSNKDEGLRVKGGVHPPEVNAAEGPPKKSSANDKIAMMRAAKSVSKPVGPSDNNTAHAPQATAPAAIVAERATVEATAQSSATPPVKALSPAEKIALMKAGKKPPVATAPAPAAPPPLADAPPAAAKGLSPAEKIALMKAGKKPAAPSADKSIDIAGSPPSAPSPSAAPAVAPPQMAKVVRPKPTLDPASFKQAATELQRFYLQDVRPYLDPKYLRRHPLANVSMAAGVFAAVRATLPAEWHARLDELAALCDQRRQLALQVRIHHWLHGWLAVHLPLSLVLLGLGIAHVIASLYW